MVRAIGLCVLAMALGACDTEQRTDRPSAPRERWPDSATWENAANQPLPPGVARITIERYEVDQRDREAIEAAIRYKDERISVSAGGLGGSNGLTVFGAGSGVSGALRSSRDSRYTRRSSSQFLLLNEGTEGSLQMIELSPRPWLVVVPVYRGAVLVRTIREQVTGTGMFVKVGHATPSAVTVELLPYFDRRRGDGGRIAVTELRTTLTVVPGQSYVVMQDQQHANSVATGLLYRHSEQRDSQVIAVLRVDVGR